MDGSRKQQKKVSFDDEKYRELEQCHNIMADDGIETETVEYNPDLAQVMAQIIVDINTGVTTRGLDFVKVFAQQYMLGKGLKKFGERGENATIQELEQLHK